MQRTIQEMQEDIIGQGWVFAEHTFPNGDVFIRFKKTEEFNPYMNSPHFYSADGWILGWGRFQRQHAWEMAYRRIIMGVED